MTKTCAEVEEPLFLDEPPEAPNRVVQDESEADALSAFADEHSDAPAGPAPGASPSAALRPPQHRLRIPMLAAVILLGVAAGFAVMLMLLG